MSINKKIYLSLIIFIFVGFCFIFFIFSFLFKGIKKDSEGIIFQKEKINFLEAKIKNIEEFKNFYNEIYPNFKKIDNLFVDSEMPIDFIDFLEKTSKDCGISIETTLISPRKDDQDWDYLSFQITSKSHFSRFMIFLKKIENSPYLINVQSLSTRESLDQTTVPEESIEENIVINLVIKVYVK